MRKFAMISRHKATEAQHKLAEDQGIALIEIGDRDAFSVSTKEINNVGSFDGVVVVHPAAAMRLAGSFAIGVFKNANRAPAGEKPQFEAQALEVYDLTD